MSDGSEIDRAYIGGGLAAGVALIAIVVVVLVIVRYVYRICILTVYLHMIWNNFNYVT